MCSVSYKIARMHSNIRSKRIIHLSISIKFVYVRKLLSVSSSSQLDITEGSCQIVEY